MGADQPFPATVLALLVAGKHVRADAAAVPPVAGVDVQPVPGRPDQALVTRWDPALTGPPGSAVTIPRWNAALIWVNAYQTTLDAAVIVFGWDVRPTVNLELPALLVTRPPPLFKGRLLVDVAASYDTPPHPALKGVACNQRAGVAQSRGGRGHHKSILAWIIPHAPFFRSDFVWSWI